MDDSLNMFVDESIRFSERTPLMFTSKVVSGINMDDDVFETLHNRTKYRYLFYHIITGQFTLNYQLSESKSIFFYELVHHL